MTIKFDASREAFDLIDFIANRYIGMCARLGMPQPNKMTLTMDLTACHVNGCVLKLTELADADDLDFAHDVGGIQRHINRQTGKLEDCFLPRFAL